MATTLYYAVYRNDALDLNEIQHPVHCTATLYYYHHDNIEIYVVDGGVYLPSKSIEINQAASLTKFIIPTNTIDIF